ncbi:MAG: hypothetical protein IJ048_07610 [Clostridia bacterium]|nr:hypothetical protein [Clostridia bacterium]
MKKLFFLSMMVLIAVSSCAMAEIKPPAPVTVCGRPETDTSSLIPIHSFTLSSTHAVDGRQGIACEGGEFWVSGSATLSHYDANWELLDVNEIPFAALEYMESVLNRSGRSSAG